MRVLIDIDDTITNFCNVLLNDLNRIHNTNYIKEDITSWNWLSETFKEPWIPLEKENFWNRVIVFPDAINFIEELRKNKNEVYLITAAFPSDTLGIKIRSTISFFNSDLINYKNVIVCQDKSIVNGDIRVDDGIHNLINNDSVNCLYSQPWNKNIDVKKYKNLMRIDSFNQLKFLNKKKV